MEKTEQQQSLAMNCPCAGACKPQNIHGKPVVKSNTRILNTNSGFGKKGLCDGPTFTAGTSCVFTCIYCFVFSMLGKYRFVRDSLAQVKKSFQQAVIRRADAPARLRKELQSHRSLSQQSLVIYGSPLVDVAPTMELAQETIEICKVILEETRWTIRLLSKSPLLIYVARGIPAQWKARVIFGISTGTLDDTIARAIEPDAPLVTKRLLALRKLQTEGFRTFAMLCPVLPVADRSKDQAAANTVAAQAFAEKAAELIDFSRCEHVWAEPINAKDKDLFNRVISGVLKRAQTVSAEDSATLRKAADRLTVVQNKALWEDYARSLFLALAPIVPAGKLRFLQYVTKPTEGWWQSQMPSGAMPLRRVRSKPAITTSPASNSTAPAPAPTPATPVLTPAKKAWVTMRQRYTPAQISARAHQAAKKAHQTMRAKAAQAATVNTVN